MAGIGARISGCANQTELSLDDQVDLGKQLVVEMYDGPVKYHVVATTGKGERLDRPELAVRRACNKTLRTTVHLWADLSRHGCAWAQAYYEKKKADGMSHAAAIRCLGHRWLKIVWKMWQTRTPYNEALHMKNQTRYGSWIIQLLPSHTTQTERPNHRE